MAHVTTLGPLAELAQDQWGLITRRQARQAGVAPATMTRLIANGVLDRVASGVYRLAGAPVPDHLELRAAWLQLAPEVPAWERRPEQGVVSHRSAASLYGIGDLPADVHEFTMPVRRQTRRPDVRLHLRDLDAAQCSDLRGLPVTRPARIASDLLYDHQDPEAVGRIVVEATQQVYDYPGTFADTLGPHAFRFGFRRGDGVALLRWLYELGGDPDVDEWMRGAREHVAGGRRDEAVAP